AGDGGPVAGSLPEQPLAAARPAQGAARTGEGVRGALRQGVPRQTATTGPRASDQGGRSRLRAGRGEVRRREAPRRREGRGGVQDGTVRDPQPERGQGGTGHRGRGPGRQAVQAQRVPREGGPARLLELRLTDLTGPVAPRAVARQEPARQAV